MSAKKRALSSVGSTHGGEVYGHAAKRSALSASSRRISVEMVLVAAAAAGAEEEEEVSMTRSRQIMGVGCGGGVVKGVQAVVV